MFGWFNSNVNVNEISSIAFHAGKVCNFKSFAFALLSVEQVGSIGRFVDAKGSPNKKK